MSSQSESLTVQQQGIYTTHTLVPIVTASSIATNDSRRPLRKRSTHTLTRAEEGQGQSYPEPIARRRTTVASQQSLQGGVRTQSGWEAIKNALARVNWNNPFTPAKKLAPSPNISTSIRNIIFYSWFNLLLSFIPVSFTLHFAVPEQHAAIFSTSFIGIIPLAHLLSFATEEVSLRVGQAMAGLINATLGNVVELIVAIIALIHCELDIVQSSLIGSILGNLLLVLGMCFFLGGMRFSEQGFAMGAAQLNSSLLTLSVVAVLLPMLYKFSADSSGADEIQTQVQILRFSHGMALILLFGNLSLPFSFVSNAHYGAVYGGYLVFQLVSHKEVYADDSADILISTPWIRDRVSAGQCESPTVELQVFPPTPTTRVPPVAPMQCANLTSEPEETESRTGLQAIREQSEQIPTPELHIAVCLGLLVIVTVLVALVAEYLVDSINGLTESGKVSKAFVGIVLLPIAGNIAEHVSAVTSSVKDKLTLSLSIAVGSSIQIALFVIPLIVIVGWGADKPMSFLFDPMQAVCLLLAVLTVNYVVADGKSNWLEGMILIALYCIIGTLFFFYSTPTQAIALACK
ncbi:hypothetical protein MIND_01354700 [Mycena indigotica]|uniref:Sodium/calcium exchanger membrane region domain-containing protein n=1 Tax=Mycena indigotica TaxID=2126181 RepID=A0A8H6RYS2_9AGAR|nr:uncharacterized protein MIND_01354700 [Mycena indigotica]KAF7289804.1 hypothetical protein MIND_01354700 [Mycena indigotica]